MGPVTESVNAAIIDTASWLESAIEFKDRGDGLLYYEGPLNEKLERLYEALVSTHSANFLFLV